MGNSPYYVGGKFGGFGMEPPAAPRPGMFGGGGRNWVNLAANFLTNLSAAQGNPAALATMQAQFQQRQEAGQAKAREMARQQGLDDRWSMFQREHEYTAAHPQPPAPTELERLMQLGGIDPRSPQGVAMARSAAQAAANPPVAVDVQLPDGSTERRWITRPLPQAPAVLNELPPNAVPLPAGGAVSGPRPFR